jgi:hypothetical protein
MRAKSSIFLIKNDLILNGESLQIACKDYNCIVHHQKNNGLLGFLFSANSKSIDLTTILF